MKKINVINAVANNNVVEVVAEEIKFSFHGLTEETRAITMTVSAVTTVGNIYAYDAEKEAWMKAGFYRWNADYKHPVIFAADKRRIAFGDEVDAIAVAVAKRREELLTKVAPTAPVPARNPLAERYLKEGKEAFKQEDFWTGLGVAPKYAKLIAKAYSDSEVAKLEEIKGVGPKTAKMAREAFKAIWA